jgi:putative salt-induced outer membrane protein YdiY
MHEPCRKRNKGENMRKKMMRTMIASGVALACVNGVMAEDSDGWESELVAGLSLTDGNSETLLLNIGVGTKKISGDNESFLNAAYSYGESTTDDVESTTTDNAKASAQYNRKVTDATYGYLKANYLYDTIADIDYRVVVGPSIGRYLIQDDAASLAVELGVAWQAEEVGGVEDDFVVLRVAQRYARKLSENASVWQSVEYLPEIEDFGNYLLNFEIGAEAAMTEAASLRVVFTDRYDSEPAADTDDNDISLTAGLVYKL